MNFLLIVFPKNNIHHQFAGSTEANLHRAQQAAVIADIIKGILVLRCKIFYSQPDGICGLGLQVAGLNVNDFIKPSFGMKTGKRTFPHPDKSGPGEWLQSPGIELGFPVSRKVHPDPPFWKAGRLFFRKFLCPKVYSSLFR